MAAQVRAIYEAGRLRLLEPVNLVDGQTVNVTIDADTDMSTADIDARLFAAGLLAEIQLPEGAVELSDQERERIGSLFADTTPSDLLIDEDRGNY